MVQHHDYLRRALSLANSRRGYCAPNPAVGAVVVHNGAIIGEGCHHHCGADHAEVAALSSIGGGASGATLYVTLEPCCHYGRTPPCTKAIKQAGIVSVIYGYKDPNPKIDGSGHKALHSADIHCMRISLPEIDQFYESYTHWLHTSRPFVTAKIAMSLDGKIAGIAGQRLSITGTEMKQYTYKRRQRSDAILTTAKTIALDDPRLDIRLADQPETKPIYIIDRLLQLTEDHHIWSNASPITVFYSAAVPDNLVDIYRKPHIIYVPITEIEGQLDLLAILDKIGADGIHDLWVEAGGKLLQSLLTADLVDDLVLYIAPTWCGIDNQSAFTGLATQFPQFASKRWAQLGPDFMCEMTRHQIISAVTE